MRGGDCIAKYDDWVDKDGKIHPDRAVLLVGWARDGLSEQQIARDKMGIAYSTFRDWKRRFPAFSAVIKNGKDVADYAVENALYKKAIGGDTTAMIFWLKNRKPQKWRDHPTPGDESASLAKAREILGGVDSGID